MTEFPITLKVSTEGPGKGYTAEHNHKGKFISIRTEPRIDQLEAYIARGREEMDLYEEIRAVSEPIFILKGLEDFGFTSFPELAEVFKKVDEDRWEDITDEERSLVEKAWRDAAEKEWVMTWALADVDWSPEATHDKEIFYAKHSYDVLMAMKVDEIKDIAKIKGVSPAGTKDEIARRIHQHDFGEEEVGKTIESIEKLMTTIGDHRRVEPEKPPPWETRPIADELKPLAEVARKHKTAEEFRKVIHEAVEAKPRTEHQQRLVDLILKFNTSEETAYPKPAIENFWKVATAVSMILVPVEGIPEVKPEEVEAEKPEEQVKLTPENIEWAIDETLTHYAEDWLKLSVRALLEEGKRDEALKFLREHCRWFGVASPGKPYVSGSEKGILITSAIMNPEETKLITWAELLKRVEAEEIKKLEEF